MMKKVDDRNILLVKSGCPFCDRVRISDSMRDYFKIVDLNNVSQPGYTSVMTDNNIEGVPAIITSDGEIYTGLGNVQNFIDKFVNSHSGVSHLKRTSVKRGWKSYYN